MKDDDVPVQSATIMSSGHGMTFVLIETTGLKDGPVQLPFGPAAHGSTGGRR